MAAGQGGANAAGLAEAAQGGAVVGAAGRFELLWADAVPGCGAQGFAQALVDEPGVPAGAAALEEQRSCQGAHVAEEVASQIAVRVEAVVEAAGRAEVLL